MIMFEVYSISRLFDGLHMKHQESQSVQEILSKRKHAVLEETESEKKRFEEIK